MGKKSRTCAGNFLLGNANIWSNKTHEKHWNNKTNRITYEERFIERWEGELRNYCKKNNNNLWSRTSLGKEGQHFCTYYFTARGN